MAGVGVVVGVAVGVVVAVVVGMNKVKIISYILVVILAFALGRYTATTQTVKVETHADTRVTDDKDIHKVEVITKEPTGIMTDTITTDTIDLKQIAKTVDTTQTTTQTKASRLNISALAGTDLSKGLNITPVYGAAITKDVLGPVSIGAFGLTNGTMGVSIGISF